jgi:hypothetical protein
VVPETLAAARFLLGNERGARKAWESLLAVGSPSEQTAARVGLGVIAIRVSTRFEDPQDRAFALTEALRHLEQADDDPPHGAAARFDRAVALALLDRPEDALTQAAELDKTLRETLTAWMEAGALPATVVVEVE